jgi:DNA invertase Pin-like site-specific DNA recombinase
VTPAQARRIDDVRRLHMLSAMAQSVAETISSNTVSALAAARKPGIPLGASRDGSYRFTAANKSQRGQHRRSYNAMPPKPGRTTSRR